MQVCWVVLATVLSTASPWFGESKPALPPSFQTLANALDVAVPRQFEQARGPQPPEKTYDYSPWQVYAVVGGAIITAVLFGAESSIAPTHCRWCDVDAEGRDTLNGLDRSFRSLVWSNPGLAGTISDLTGLVAPPLAAVGLNALAAAHDDRLLGASLLADSLVMGEALLTTAAVTQITKVAVSRQRPRPHDLAVAGTLTKDDESNNSFFSGHTSMSFSAAASAGTIASLRGYRWAPWVWAGGMTLAATTGYLRMAADEHYVTDVLTGAVVGSAIGVVFPLVLHRKQLRGEEATLSFQPYQRDGGAGLTVSWRPR